MTTLRLGAPRLVEAPTSTGALISDALALLEAAARSLSDEKGRYDETSPGVRAPVDALLGLIGGEALDPVDLGVPVARSRLILVSADAAQVLDGLRRHTRVPTRVLQTTVAANDWLLLVPGLPRPAREDVAARDTDAFVAALHRTAIGGWHAGISAAVRDASELPGAFRDARDLAALAAREQQQALTVDEAWARLTVERVRSARWVLPTASPLDVLKGYDHENGTSLGETVAVWLTAACDSQTTARALRIHVNTLRYRLRRAASIAGLDLQDAHQRLVLQLTLRVGAA